MESLSLGQKGRALFVAAHQEHDSARGGTSAASGVILHRKDHLVLDGGFKWVACLWRFQGQSLVLSPHLGADGARPPSGAAAAALRLRVRRDTQFTRPKRKNYPVQFGTATVHTATLLETVTYGPSGYANTVYMPHAPPAGATGVRTVAKVAALERGELEKLLRCVQAVADGHKPDHYLTSDE